ncbi:MAG: hypothetical protein K0Q99_650, partial [Clostridia bacterium]|nr:hypothetical protein [Clostridia bacterium]
MSQRRIAAILTATFIIVISYINIFIEEAWNNKVQASSFFMDNNNRKVVVLMADHIELQDFAKNDYLAWLFNNSYSALISGRQTGKASAAKAKLAIGTSKRFEISSSLRNAANYDETIENLDNQIVIGESGNVIYHDLKGLKNQNKESDYTSYIGYLGRELKQQKKTACVIGNGDTDTMNRSSVLIPMDEYGIVHAGDVENTTISDIGFPGGKRTDFTKLMSLYKKF